MKSYLSEDTDEENCDDPIKLFDNDINAVYFGSQPHQRSTIDTKSRWTFETIGNNEFCQPRENSTLGRSDDDLVLTLQSDTTSECDINPLCVKLVDCGKFPWYYRKYAEQIMHKLNLNELSDSASMVDDSDDCFIVEDLQDFVTNKIITSDQICISAVKSIEPNPKLPKNKLNKSLENMKRHKDDKEIQRALSIKNLVKVDLKRNQGLIGMKITQKMELNTTLEVKTDKDIVVEETDAKETCVMADEKYLSAADKILCHIGTQLIPITDERENSSICQLNIDNKEKDLVGKATLVKSSTFPNVTVQFDIRKISEKIIDNLKTKKINEQSSEAKLISKLSNKNLLNNPENTFKTVNEKELTSKVTILEKCTNSSNTLTSHVKDVKKTNKYKNDQIKIKKNSTNHRSLIGLLVTKKTKEDIKEIKCKKQKRRREDTQNKATKLDKKPRIKIEKQRREPKSPILHCSTVPKKPKQHGLPPKCNKTDTNSNTSKEPGKLKQIVDKLTNLNSCNLMQDSNRLKHVIPKIASATKPLEVYAKQASQKESMSMIQDKTVSQVRNIHAKSLSVSDKLSKNCNEVSKSDFKCNNFRNTQIMSSTKNKTLNEQTVLYEPHQVNKHTINAASSVTDPTPKAPIKNNKPTVSNSNVSTTAVVTPASGSNAVLPNQFANFPTPHGPNFPIHNAVSSKMSSSNISSNNINVPVQNRYASAIILKSNNHTNFPFEKYCETPVQTMALQRPTSFPIPVLSHTQPRSRDPQQPYPIFYPPAPLGRHQNNFQSSANSVPNQFHPPQSYIGQLPSNSMQDFYREHWLPQTLEPPPPPPPPPPVPPLNIPPRNGHVVNQSEDCSNLNHTSTSFMQNPQSAFRQNSVNTQQTQNSSIIGMNNDGLVKKINIVAMPVKNVGTVGVEQIKASQIMSPVEHSEVVTTKTEMLRELDKLSFVDKNTNEFKGAYPACVINEKKKENTLEVEIMSKNPGRFETLKLTMNQKDSPVQTKPAQGYSPPILPIPTYQRVLDRMTSNLQIENATPKICPGDLRSTLKNECKLMRKRDFVKCCKRKLNNASNNDEDSRRKYDAKKISLEEYKKRILKNDDKSEHYKKICQEKYDNSGKRPNLQFMYRKNIDYSTETDLGYDSDSTVVL